MKLLSALQTFAFMRLLVRSYSSLMLRLFCLLLPRAVHSVYVKGGFARKDWDFVLSDIDLVIFLSLDDLEELEKVKTSIFLRRRFIRLFCPWLWDIDVWRCSDAQYLFRFEPFYKRDLKNWKRLGGEELRGDLLSSSLTPYDYLETIYFYFLWFGKKWQRMHLVRDYREEKSLKRLLEKWKSFLESFGEASFLPLSNLPQYECFLALVNSSLAVFNKSFNLKSYGAIAMSEEVIFCKDGPDRINFCDDFALYVNRPEEMLSVVQGPFRLWIPDEFFRPMAKLGIIRLWELRELYLRHQQAFPEEWVGKLYIRSLRFWTNWGRQESLFHEWLKRLEETI